MKIVNRLTPDWAQLAATTLEQGGIVLHPTDTAYGLAVDATNPAAIKKVFRLKQRQDKPLIVVVCDLAQAEEYVEVTDAARRLAGKFWPGALTLVLPKKDRVPEELTCGSLKVGIRQPDHPVTRELSELFPLPYTSTSANLSGGPTPYTVQDALAQLDESLIDLVIDAGPLPVHPTSTVVDLTTDPPQILREGGITTDEIFTALK